jgi:hypothetical protein
MSERLELARAHLIANVGLRGEPFGVRCTRRHLPGYLRGLANAAGLRRELFACDTLAGNLDILDRYAGALAA